MDSESSASSASSPSSESSTPVVPAPALQQIQTHNVLLFGLECELNELSLPTSFDILKYYFFLTARCKVQNKLPSHKTFTPNVVDKLIEIWNQLNIAIMDRKGIARKLNVLIDRYHQANKNNFSRKYENFVDNTKEIFFIGQCNCSLKTHECKCGKIPSHLKEFMFDQHTERKLTILQDVPPADEDVATSVPTLASAEDPTYKPSFSEFEDDFELPGPSSRPAAATVPVYSTRNTLPKLAMMCDRFGVSNRLASCIVSAVLDDFGIKDEHNKTIVIDKRKIGREREKARNECLRKRYDGESLAAFSFDGRKNDALTREKIDQIYHSKMHKESHLVVVREPHSSLLGYVNLDGKGESAKAKRDALIEFFETKGLSLDELFGICSDGEVTNTGTSGGILRLFEEHLNRPIHWFICLLHFNELPFRHLYDALEKSVTTGPRTATGVLAKQMDVCNTLQVLVIISFVNFLPYMRYNFANLHYNKFGTM